MNIVVVNIPSILLFGLGIFFFERHSESMIGPAFLFVGVLCLHVYDSSKESE